MPAILSTLQSAMPQIINAMFNALITLLPLFVECGFKLLVAIIQNIGAAIGQIVAAMPSIIRGMIDALRQGVSQFISMGGQLIQGLISGVKNAAGALIGAVKNVVGSAIGAVKNFLGIHSPSRVFAEIGQFTMKGLQIGIEDQTKNTVRVMKSAIGKVSDAANLKLDAPTVSFDFRNETKTDAIRALSNREYSIELIAEQAHKDSNDKAQIIDKSMTINGLELHGQQAEEMNTVFREVFERFGWLEAA